MADTAITEMLNTAKAAERLGIHPRTLNVWRSTKRYALPYVKVGRCVRYKDRDIDVFISKRTKGEIL